MARPRPRAKSTPEPAKPGRSPVVPVVAIALALLVGVAAIWLLPPRRTSVLLVTLDTLRADHVGAYGYAAGETPNLDRLASRGARFARAQAPVPLTGPSHATLMT